MKRTPKNYDGTVFPARTLGDLLPEILQQMRKTESGLGEELLRAWPEVIGCKFAQMTEAVSFVDGVLTVLVKSSALYSVLCQHERPRLLAEVQKRFPKTQVRNIAFRIG